MAINLFKLLPELLERMPKWAQITAFFVVLSLTVYLYLAPTFIDGQVVAETTHGGLVPYRGVDINVTIESRTMKFKTNENGDWSVPLVSRLPESLRLMVYHEDEHAFFEVMIDPADMWFKDFRIVVETSPPGMRLQTLAAAETLWLARVLAKLMGVDTAQAGELIIKDVPMDPQQKQQIANDLNQLVAEVLKKDPAQLDGDAPLAGPQAPAYALRVQIIQDIEREYDIAIPDEHWRNLKNLNELSDYVYKRNLLKARNASSPSPQAAESWNQLQQQFAPEQRPIFLPEKAAEQ